MVKYSLQVGKVNLEDRIRKELARLKKNIEKTKSPQLILYYVRGFEGLKDFVIDNRLPIDIPSVDYDWNYLANELDDSNSFINSYNQMYKTNIKISNMGRHLFDKYGFFMLGDYTQRIEVNDAALIAYDFLNLYDEEVAACYLKLIKEESVRYIDKDGPFICGATYDIKPMNSSLINLYDSETIDLAGTIIHEVIHAYVNSKRVDKDYASEFNYLIMNLMEVYSEFIELVFLDYLEKIHFPKKDILAYGSKYNASLMCDLMNFGEIIYSYGANDILSSETLYSDYTGLSRYVYGRIMGYLYYERYLKKPEHTKKQILQMTLDSTKYDKKYLLNNYGLHDKDLYNEQKLTRSMQRFYNY